MNEFELAGFNTEQVKELEKIHERYCLWGITRLIIINAIRSFESSVIRAVSEGKTIEGWLNK